MEEIVAFFEDGPAVYFKWKNEEGWPVAFVSGNVELLLGYSASDFYSGNVVYSEIIHPEDLERVFFEVTSNVENNSKSFSHEPYRIQKKNGEYCWLKDVTKILRNSEGEIEYFIGFIIDITHEKTLENRLTENKNQLDMIFNTTRDGIAILKLDSSFVDFNNAYMKMTGFAREELLQKKCIDLTVPEDKERTQEVIKEVIKKGFVDFFEKTCIVARNERRAIQMSLALMDDKEHILIATRDVTDRVELEKERDSYIDIIDKNVITSKTDLDGTIIEASQKFCEISGFSKEELIGSNHNIIRHPDTPNAIFEKMWQTITSGKTWNGEIKNLNRQKEEYWVRTTITPNVGEEGKVVSYTSIRQDITDKKRVEIISKTDHLTAVYNRRYFNEYFEEILQLKDVKKDLLFFIMDIDYFKQYNDTYGHSLGDKALKDVATKLRSYVKAYDGKVFRLGGEEFGILMICEKEFDIKTFSEKLLLTIKDLKIEHKASKIGSVLTLSIGVQRTCLGSEINQDKIYLEADNALYRAKEEGRDRVSFA